MLQIPRSVMAGVTVKWTDGLAEYSALDGWVLRYALRHPTHTKIDIASTASGSDFAFTVAATGTAGWQPGTYTWRAYVERAGEKFEVGAGEIEVIADFAAANNVDGRSLARKALDDARAAFAAWTPTRRRYKIGEREMEFSDTAEIIRAISYWQAEVDREDLLAGRRRELGRRIYSRI
jgi:hypothetical protein